MSFKISFSVAYVSCTLLLLLGSVAFGIGIWNDRVGWGFVGSLMLVMGSLVATAINQANARDGRRF